MILVNFLVTSHQMKNRNNKLLFPEKSATIPSTPIANRSDFFRFSAQDSLLLESAFLEVQYHEKFVNHSDPFFVPFFNQVMYHLYRYTFNSVKFTHSFHTSHIFHKILPITPFSPFVFPLSPPCFPLFFLHFTPYFPPRKKKNASQPGGESTLRSARALDLQSTNQNPQNL